jgi:hypothetical protein
LKINKPVSSQSSDWWSSRRKGSIIESIITKAGFACSHQNQLISQNQGLLGYNLEMSQGLFDRSINAELPSFDLDSLRDKFLGPPFILPLTVLDQIQQ